MQPATAGDTRTLHETLTHCSEHIREVAADMDNKVEQLNPEGPAELVLDKGYHSNDVLIILKEVAVRSYWLTRGDVLIGARRSGGQKNLRRASGALGPKTRGARASECAPDAPFRKGNHTQVRHRADSTGQTST
jgi:hypothetical protein